MVTIKHEPRYMSRIWTVNDDRTNLVSRYKNLSRPRIRLGRRGARGPENRRVMASRSRRQCCFRLLKNKDVSRELFPLHRLPPASAQSHIETWKSLRLMVASSLCQIPVSHSVYLHSFRGLGLMCACCSSIDSFPDLESKQVLKPS